MSIIQERFVVTTSRYKIPFNIFVEQQKLESLERELIADDCGKEEDRGEKLSWRSLRAKLVAKEGRLFSSI